MKLHRDDQIILLRTFKKDAQEIESKIKAVESILEDINNHSQKLDLAIQKCAGMRWNLLDDDICAAATEIYSAMGDVQSDIADLTTRINNGLHDACVDIYKTQKEEFDEKKESDEEEYIDTRHYRLENTFWAPARL